MYEATFFKKCLPELKKNGFELGRRQNEKSNFSIFRKKKYIDIDIYGKNRKCFATYPFGKTCDWLEPLLKPYGKATINNIEYNVPSMKYIEKLYGKERWKTPSGNHGHG